MAFFTFMFGFMKGASFIACKLGRKTTLTLLAVFTVVLLGLALGYFFISETYKVHMLVGCGLLASIITGLGHRLKEIKSAEDNN